MGRPKGSKNQTTVDKLRKAAEEYAALQKPAETAPVELLKETIPPADPPKEAGEPTGSGSSASSGANPEPPEKLSPDSGVSFLSDTAPESTTPGDSSTATPDPIEEDPLDLSPPIPPKRRAKNSVDNAADRIVNSRSQPNRAKPKPPNPPPASRKKPLGGVFRR